MRSLGIVQDVQSNSPIHKTLNVIFVVILQKHLLNPKDVEGSQWSCGYRNIQMLCHSLIKIPCYRARMFGGVGD
eukprot:gene46634-62379_t